MNGFNFVLHSMFPTSTSEFNPTIGSSLHHHTHVAKAFTLKEVAKKGSEKVKAKTEQIYQTFWEWLNFGFLCENSTEIIWNQMLMIFFKIMVLIGFILQNKWKYSYTIIQNIISMFLSLCKSYHLKNVRKCKYSGISPKIVFWIFSWKFHLPYG